MRILFTAGGSQAVVFGVAPLANAARNAGHHVLLAVDEPLLDAAASVGLPAVCITTVRMQYGQEERTAHERLRALVELTSAWVPDLVIGGLSPVPRILAAHLDVPFVRQMWQLPAHSAGPGMARASALTEPMLRSLGLHALPMLAHSIDVCPPILRSTQDEPPALSMRWLPRVRQTRLEPWMYTKPADRPRVLVTAGTRHSALDIGGPVQPLIEHLQSADVDVLVAAVPSPSADLDEASTTHVGWMPLDVVAPTCDVAIHHGGATTTGTLLHAAVPQVIVPDNGFGRGVGQAVADFGAALLIEATDLCDDDSAGVLARLCLEVCERDEYRDRARLVAEEVDSLPTPAAVLQRLEGLTQRP